MLGCSEKIVVKGVVSTLSMAFPIEIGDLISPYGVNGPDHRTGQQTVSLRVKMYLVPGKEQPLSPVWVARANCTDLERGFSLHEVDPPPVGSVQLVWIECLTRGWRVTELPQHSIDTCCPAVIFRV